MNILIVTDAWLPQVNGVVTTLINTRNELEKLNHRVTIIEPSSSLLFNTVPLPSYPQISIVTNPWRINDLLEDEDFDAIHIATEGPLGIFARRYCLKNNIPFTTSYHTKFPEYIKKRLPFIPISIAYAFERWFHGKSNSVLVTTTSMRDELEDKNISNNLVIWSRGVDTKLFKPSYRKTHPIKQKPVLLYVGRLSEEKNIEAFLEIDPYCYEYEKVVVGDGPLLNKLLDKYREVNFKGVLKGEALAKVYANADVFVFPSKTDTFGLVMIEAAACGTPIAAYPVTGPIDIVLNGVNGYLREQLEVSIRDALLHIDRKMCAEYTRNKYKWKNCSKIFLESLVKIK